MIDSRLGRDGSEIRRRRECIECGRRFTTRERVDEILPKICKRDERREDYEREKLVAGIRKACEKRAVSADAIERLADRVERHLQETGEKEVPTALIGERSPGDEVDVEVTRRSFDREGIPSSRAVVAKVKFAPWEQKPAIDQPRRR